MYRVHLAWAGFELTTFSQPHRPLERILLTPILQHSYIQCLSSGLWGCENVVSSNPAQARCTRYNVYVINLSVTCGRSVVFSGYSTNKTDRHDINEILVKVALNTINQAIKTSCENEIRQSNVWMWLLDFHSFVCVIFLLCTFLKNRKL